MQNYQHGGCRSGGPFCVPAGAAAGHAHSVMLGVDAALAAPIGVALLDRLELAARGAFRPFDALQDSDPVAVAAACDQVHTMPVGSLLAETLDAASLAGPWSSGAVDSLTWAYRLAGVREPLAEAVWTRFGGRLAGPLDRDAQEHWIDERDPSRPLEAAFGDYEDGYGNGEFTWAGVWTVTSPPPEIHDPLIAAWEMDRGRISRWRLPVRHDVRVWEIDHPRDWVRLIETFPRVATRPHYGWELPGPNQHSREMSRLLALRWQHAVRVGIGEHLVPDWAALAERYDGVHLSWAGFLTAEGYVTDMADGAGTMLRYWGSERTLWLHDVFGEPQPTEAPALSGAINGALGADVLRNAPQQRLTDLRYLNTRLRRPNGARPPRR